MTAKQSIDKELLGRAGVVDRSMQNARLEITEKPHQHRAIAETDCHDCGNLITPGEPFVVSALECKKGMKAQQYRYSVHLACYDIVGRVVLIVGKNVVHTFEGRAPLPKLWKAHKAEIRAADPGLANMLQGAFGK